MRKFSGKNVHCNGCGELMTVYLDENTLYCPECDNECYLDETDPDDESLPMQMMGKYGYEEFWPTVIFEPDDD